MYPRLNENARVTSRGRLAGSLALAGGSRVKIRYAPYDWTTNGTENSPEYARAKVKANYNRVTGW